MAERIVVDASIAISLLVAEPASPKVRLLVRRWADLGAELIVPTHFWLEVTNVLSRRYRRPSQTTIEDLILLDGLGLRTLEADRPLLLLAIDAMARRRTQLWPRWTARWPALPARPVSVWRRPTTNAWPSTGPSTLPAIRPTRCGYGLLLPGSTSPNYGAS
jgi:predicted nucleic acid-binding protein